MRNTFVHITVIDSVITLKPLYNCFLDLKEIFCIKDNGEDNAVSVEFKNGTDCLFPHYDFDSFVEFFNATLFD